MIRVYNLESIMTEYLLLSIALEQRLLPDT